MKNDLVTIVIPVYNGANYLREAIESAINQTYKNIEIIVVNDGSTDKETEEIALEYKDKIRYYYKSNGGVATALNYAIRRMKGEYFSWLSHDDTYYPNKIERQMDAINKSSAYDSIVYSAYDIFYEKNKIKVSITHKEKYGEGNLNNSVFPVLFGLVNGCTVLIHKSHFERVGQFNEKLLTTQDYDLWFRLFRDQKSIYINEPLIISRQHEKQGSKIYQEYNEERENLYIDFMKSLSTSEIKSIYNNLISFYFKMAVFFEARGMQNAYKYAYEKLANTDDEFLLNNPYESIKRLARYSKNNISKICLFGMGAYGKQLFEELICRMVPIYAFIDNNPKKWGTEYKGIKCIPIDQLKEENENVLIIVSMLNSDQIMHQLKENKLNNIITLRDIEKLLVETDPIGWLVKERIQMNSTQEYQLVHQYNQALFDLSQQNANRD